MKLPVIFRIIAFGICLTLCSCADDTPYTCGELARLTANAMTNDYLYTNADYSEVTVADFANIYNGLAEIYGDLPALTRSDDLLTLGVTEKLLLGAANADGSAVEMGYMKPFPANCSDIDRDYVLHLPELPEIALYFAEAVTKRGSEEAEENADALLKSLTRGSDSHTVSTPAWFVTQHDGGEQSEINCMPSIACMAIRRFTDKTPIPDELRRELNADGEWYLYDVSRALSHYGVENETAPLSQSAIIAALDDGKIILVKCSYANTNSISHCMVIYGYEGDRNALRFLCADPDKRAAEALPAYYAMYIAERCTERMLICG